MSTVNAHPSGLSESARRELMAERDRLRVERKRIDGLLVKIEALLGSGGRGERRDESPSGGSAHPLRPGIMKALASNPDGLRPIEVARFLEGEGWSTDGKTAFPVLVSNQLWRMAREENAQVRRSEKTGKYKLLHGIDAKTASG